jgi:hypothetical protein
MALALHLRKATAGEPYMALPRNGVPTLDPDRLIRILGHCHAHSEFQG